VLSDVELGSTLFNATAGTAGTWRRGTGALSGSKIGSASIGDASVASGGTSGGGGAWFDVTSGDNASIGTGASGAIDTRRDLSGRGSGGGRTLVGMMRVEKMGASDGARRGVDSGNTSRASEVLGHEGGSD
jgi:hypothetical protein